MEEKRNPDFRVVSESGDLLTALIATDADLEDAFRRLLQASKSTGDAPLKAVVPGELLTEESISLAELLTSINAEYEDIDRVLSSIKESEEPAAGTPTTPPTAGNRGIEDAIAFVSEEELGDPEALSRALEPLQAEAGRFESLFARAKHGLDRLDVYHLSRKPSADLIETMRQGNNLRTIQSLVEFLRALASAADSFEALEIPHLHIRDYLSYLYTMGDWNEMARLVGLLEIAVSQLPALPGAEEP